MNYSGYTWNEQLRTKLQAAKGRVQLNEIIIEIQQPLVDENNQLHRTIDKLEKDLKQLTKQVTLKLSK